MDMEKKRTGRNRREIDGKAAGVKRMIHNKIDALPEMFDIPGSAISGVAHIEMAGNREAVVDGIQGILEYDENIVKLTTGKMIIKFTGRSLQIKALTHDSAIVSGYIIHIEFAT